MSRPTANTQPATAPPPNKIDQPNRALRFCDLAMKGGITSGVVYPLAVTKLAEKFSFKNIGGTSAGAIAAAAAAAAELGRSSGGFKRLEQLPTLLGDTSPDGGKSNLFAFFQPQAITRKLFNICVAALGGGSGVNLRVFQAAVTQFPVEALLGAIPGLLLIWGAFVNASGFFFAICLATALLLLVIGVLVALVWAVLDNAGKALPSNFYGLCTGLGEVPRGTSKPLASKQSKALTDWLSEYLDELAGRKPEEPPLTFGDLWGPPNGTEAPKINLEMMTTCITHGRPYRLPFRDNDDIKENGLFYFSPRDFRCFFPERVVKWMEDNPRTPSSTGAKDVQRREALRAKGLRPLPDPRDMPVIVAVRMSLSFPVLLSAVPLYAIDRNRYPDGENPECCWFSDGGVCSNFPIHFFDAPLPRWPTLSINLVPKPRDTPLAKLEVPEMARSNGDRIQERWNRFEVEESASPGSDKPYSRERSGLGKLTGFLNAVMTTMQNWSDNTQSRLPGYRDRIADVGLTPEEGGLNLTMPKERIDNLTKRGGAVADEFIKRFATPPGSGGPEMNWPNHRWLRMRSLFASLEQMLIKLEGSCAQPQDGDPDYESWLANTKPADAPSYKWRNMKQRQLALDTLKSLRQIAKQMNECATPLGSEEAPHPRPELRTRPQI